MDDFEFNDSFLFFPGVDLTLWFSIAVGGVVLVALLTVVLLLV
jgi:hypothetical protein